MGEDSTGISDGMLMVLGAILVIAGIFALLTLTGALQPVGRFTASLFRALSVG